MVPTYGSKKCGSIQREDEGQLFSNGLIHRQFKRPGWGGTGGGGEMGELADRGDYCFLITYSKNSRWLSSSRPSSKVNPASAAIASMPSRRGIGLPQKKGEKGSTKPKNKKMKRGSSE